MASEVKVEPPRFTFLGINWFPVVRGAFNLWNRTELKRKQTIIQMNAPKPSNPLMDMYDCKQESPYETQEVLKDKVWKVAYKAENFFYTNTADRKIGKIFFGDPSTPDYQQKILAAASVYGDKAVEATKKDIEKALEVDAKTSWTKEERVESPFVINMVVVKLNNGGLALYAPVKMHKDDAPHLLVDWLKSLGTVEWLIGASSAHTLVMGDAIAAFPDAKVVGPEVCQEKFKYANLMKDKFDYVTDNKEELAKLNEVMKEGELGLEFINLEGDCATNAVVCLAHEEVVMECDVVYGHHDGHGALLLDKERFLEFRAEDWMDRMFKFSLLDKPNSPLGYLPNYRFWMMDADSMGSLFCWHLPTEEDKKKMAESLRKVCALNFHTAIGVHLNPMKGDDFRKSIDKCWNWLDGKPLC